MKKFLALITARNKEFYRDLPTLGWTLLFPFIVLVGFAYGYSGRQDPVIRVAIISSNVPDPPALLSFRQIPGVTAQVIEIESEALRKLERFESDLVVGPSNGANQIIYTVNKDSDKGKLAERLLIGEVNRQSGPRLQLESRPITGHAVRYADWVLPGLLAMNIMFGSMFGVGYVIVRYRKNGVLKRFRGTPLTSFQFLAAQVFSRMLIMTVTSIMVVVGAMLLIGFKPQGSWLDLVIFLAVSSIAMISLGLVVAARISSEEVAEGILNLMTWPMIFLSGIWFSLEGASRWVHNGATLMPLTHVVFGLRAILIDGTSLSHLLPQICILVGLSALFIGIGSFIFRWR